MRVFPLAFLFLAVWALPACRADRPGCLDNSSTRCVPAVACEGLRLTCASSQPTLFRIAQPNDRRGGDEALAAVGDYVLDNGLIRAVIDDVGNGQHLAPTGGNLLDLLEVGGIDGLNQISHVTGILPRDAVAYHSLEMRPNETVGSTTGSTAAVSLVARGRLSGDSQVTVVSRYTLAACDRGVRVRTEIYNGSREPKAFFLADTIYYGNRGLTPMVPAKGGGFSYPPLDLAEIEAAFVSMPFLSAQSHLGTLEGTSYAAVSCDRSRMQGVNATTLSAYGQPRTMLMPGDGMSFERYIAVASGLGSAPAQQVALEVRKQLLNERYITARGRVVLTPARFDIDERVASLLFVADGVPFAEAVPSSLGELRVALPAGRSYSVERYAFGRLAGAPTPLEVAGDDVDLGDIAVVSPAEINAEVTLDGAPATSELVVIRSEGQPAADGSIYGLFPGCDPYLGPPHGASPACNRVLARDGRVRFSIPPGDYEVIATHGPNATLAKARVVVAAGELSNVSLALHKLSVFPIDTLSADFHVHGARSFDSMIPERDRVLSFLAADLQVLAATDHDVVGDYSRTISELSAQSLLYAIPGVELTSLILHYKREGSAIPRTLGHFNFWPMPFNEALPRNGAPFDELKEPGQLYDELAAITGPEGVHQLNHPYAPLTVGRDEGYARAIGYDPRQDVKSKPDRSPAGQWLRRPLGGRSNLDHHAQEVMNGADIVNFLEYRELWYSLLRQNILRAGTANSDTHSLRIEQAGYPRNIVEGRHEFPALNVATFNAAVREGRMVGTNGPYILARLRDGVKPEVGPSLIPVELTGNQVLHLEVKAAPWIPVSEVRIFVNGNLVRTLPVASVPADPFSTTGVERFSADVALGDLVPNGGRLHVEAGVALPAAKDTDDDGIVDTVDTNGDGLIDRRDEEAEDPRQLPPATRQDPRFWAHTVSPGTHPNAFTNPFVLVKP